VARAKKCKACGISYITTRPLQKACSLPCAIKLGKQKTEQDQKKQEKIERAADRVKLEAFKKRSAWLNEAQAAFNKFIRARDELANFPCICCGQYPAPDDWTRGGIWDAGHFLGRGAYPELRFEELNCHRQLKTCNGGSNKYAKKGRTVAQGYREGLVDRIGLEKVKWLESHHEPKHYSIEDLKAIKREYTEKVRQLTSAVLFRNRTR
jgi:hypothetical protein